MSLTIYLSTKFKWLKGAAWAAVSVHFALSAAAHSAAEVGVATLARRALSANASATPVEIFYRISIPVQAGEGVAIDDIAVESAAVQPAFPVACQKGCVCKHYSADRRLECCGNPTE